MYVNVGAGRGLHDIFSLKTKSLSGVPLGLLCARSAPSARASRSWQPATSRWTVDKSALATRGELAVVATVEPDRLRRRLHKGTGKKVDDVFPEPAVRADSGGGRGAATAPNSSHNEDAAMADSSGTGPKSRRCCSPATGSNQVLL
jgi:hypothetical protein